MKNWSIVGLLTMSVWLTSGDAGLAQPGDAAPVVFVTSLTGQGATRGATGPSFASDRFSEEDNGVTAGESVVTPASGTAMITLPAHGVSVRLRESSELRVGSWNYGENDVPVTLTLVKGRAYILRRRVDGWLVVAAESEANSGYALSKSRSLVITSDDTGVGFAVIDGAATWFAGTIPGETLLDASGDPKDKERGSVVQAGRQISAAKGAEPVPGNLSRTVSEETARDLYAFGLGQGTRWVKDAETGDLTPVRAAARGSVHLARAQVSSELAFDQPRSVLTNTSPRTVTQPLRTTIRSPVRGLLESGLPTNVVVGQRLRRTRIIGSPGAGGGPIRVNPNVQPLLRLTGSSK